MQPYVTVAAALFDSGCNPMQKPAGRVGEKGSRLLFDTDHGEQALQPYLMEAATLADRG